jgi:DNA/RNA endonuclease YhcR with UshA esterase domain
MSHSLTRQSTNLVTSIVLAAALLVGCSAPGTNNNTTGSSTSSSSSGGDSVITISAARALPDGASATVKGFVTVAPGTFNSATGDQGFVIQDATGGVYVGLTDLLTFSLDQEVQVTGKLSQVAQQTVLATTKADVSEVAGMTKTIMPVDAKTGDVKEPVEGNLIRVAGKVTQAVMDDTPYGKKVYINDGSGEIQVFVHLVAGKPIIDTSMLAIDQMITVVGVGAQYETTYEVIPRKAEDLTK